MVNRYFTNPAIPGSPVSALPLIHKPVNEKIQHNWGAIYLTYFGIAEIHFDDNPDLVAPWQYAIWVPANTLHHYQLEAQPFGRYISVHETQAERFPSLPCLLPVSPLPVALTRYLVQAHTITHPDKCNRLALALLTELLAESNPLVNFLPESRDKVLFPILEALRANPGDGRSLVTLAETVNTSEKTLIRRFRTELQLSFREWRTRLRFLKAIRLLATPMSISLIAQQLGYRHTSSFIFTFHKITGMTPDNYRKTLPDAAARVHESQNLG